MAVYRGPYTSVDLTQGVWLDVERDELGNSRHWMTIEGEEIELTKRQYQALMEQRAEARKNAMQEAEDRIINLLKELWKTTYAKGSGYSGSNAVLDAIALIKRGQNHNETVVALTEGE